MGSEMCIRDSQLVSESRLEDLIQHAVRDHRRSLTPNGWSEFRYLLRLHNAPKFMLNRDTLDEMNRDEQSKKQPFTNIEKKGNKIDSAKGAKKSTSVPKTPKSAKKSRIPTIVKKIALARSSEDNITLRSKPTKKSTKYGPDFLKDF